MSDRADEVAKRISYELYVEGIALGTAVNLIADALREARQEEREACAKMCEVAAMGVGRIAHEGALERQARGYRDIAAAIRARAVTL